jgi:hypothetical protein
MRIAATAALMNQLVVTLRTTGLNASSAPAVLGAAAGMLLLIGLWTPIMGALVAVIELWSAFAQPGDPWICVLLGSLSAALALLGPGAYSADARILGWKRIDIGDHR